MKRLGGLVGSLFSLHGELPIVEVICFEANDFGRSQAVAEGDEDHQPVAVALRPGDSEKRQKFGPI